MNVAEVKMYLQERKVSVSEYLKTWLMEVASAVEKWSQGSKKDHTNDADNLIKIIWVIPCCGHYIQRQKNLNLKCLPNLWTANWGPQTYLLSTFS